MSDETLGLDLPTKYSDLSTWRFFIFRQFGIDSQAYAYLDRLCHEHGSDWEIDLEPEAFLEHIGRLNHVATHEA